MLVLLLLVPLVLLGSVECLYRYTLSRVGELPRVPVARTDLATRALWAATEEGPLQLEPRWPWTLVAEFAQVSWHPRHERTAGSLTSWYVARQWMTSRPGHESTSMRNWHLRGLALCMWISRHWTVEELLTAYAEGSGFGRNIIGLDAAARRYFGKAPGQLALHEAALLAGLPQSPARYDPFCQPERALQRRNVVLSRLQGLGWISEAQGEEARKQPLPPAIIAEEGAGACAHDQNTPPGRSRLQGE
ncbi:transglycosylase domain-containing protein [Archangium violaceum]|uniref:transglycosylase domain-containing protein n=1 Tax=Archangium violaceum TaxID=83451 RepID=UPI0036DA678C